MHLVLEMVPDLTIENHCDAHRYFEIYKKDIETILEL
jgi:hypothetical protein